MNNYPKYLLYKYRCPECGNREHVTDATKGEIICKCGLILPFTMFSKDPEWRTYTPEDKKQKERVGLPLTLTRHDMGLQTTFNISRDSYGKILPKNIQLKMMRLKRWQKGSNINNNCKSNLKRAMIELERINDKLNLPSYVHQEAALIYRKVLGIMKPQGRSIIDMIAASIHLACRINGLPRKISEVINASGGDRKRISRYYREIVLELNIKIPPDEPIKYISKIANIAHIDTKTQNRAIELLRKAKRYTLLGKNPSGLAAALLYIACIENSPYNRKTQMELAKYAGVTKVTIRNRYQQLVKDLNIKVPWIKNESP